MRRQLEAALRQAFDKSEWMAQQVEGTYLTSPAPGRQASGPGPGSPADDPELSQAAASPSMPAHGRPGYRPKRFVHSLQVEHRIPFYGFHASAVPFVKIFLLDPAFVRKAATVLQVGPGLTLLDCLNPSPP